MVRGVYFDAWFPRQHCYHPSLPPRRLRMIDHLAEYRATTLVWAALGGGSISLPFLEQEAWREEAEKRGYDRIAELADYLQADELTHVKLATHWIRELVDDDPAHRDELVAWGRRAVARIGSFWNEDSAPEDVHFTFLRGTG